jgi:hypothetical protein
MRMVREFPSMAVAMMQELAERLAATNNQLSTAQAELRRLQGQGGIAA